MSPAQALTITDSSDASILADALFLDLPNGLTVSDSSLSGFLGQAGTYTNETGTYGLPNTGIILSTGNVSQYGSSSDEVDGGDDFPNEDFPIDEVFIGEDFAAPTVSVSAAAVQADVVTNPGQAATAGQQERLVDITGASSHFDVVELSIDFEVGTGIDQITFFGAFGSNEWPEFVGSSFNDGFGLFVNGVNVAGVQPTDGGENLPVNINHPDMTSIDGTSLNGLLAPNGIPVLRFDVPVEVGQNHFDILLADAGDSVVDTTIYLSSFFATDGGTGGGTPVTNTGETEQNPILPSNPQNEETGEFVVVIPEFDAGELIWIDPPVTTGYVYDAGTTAFETLTAPSLATVADLDGYVVKAGGAEYTIAAGETIDFNDIFGFNPTTFEITGINPDLSLQPDDAAAFPVGVSFVTAGFNLNVSITPTTIDVGPSAVPLPATGLLLGFSLLAFGAARRGRKTRS